MRWGEGRLLCPSINDALSHGPDTNIVHADSTSTRSDYFANRLLQKTWGSRIYPVEYQYDHAGRMTNMTTWQDFNETTGAGTTGSAATKWLYDSSRGWLSQKKYADNTGPSYTYTAAGRLKSRAWVRGVTTWYTNNNAGELWVVNYTDTTADVTNTYDRRGRLTNVLSGATSLRKIYNDAGNLLRESYSGGPLNGLSVTNGYDLLLRRTNISILNSPSSILASTAYAYDSGSRLLTITDGTNSATYDYLDNSALVEQIAFATNGTTVMTTTKSYDYLNRLTNILSINAQPATISSFAYAYNTANQRTSVTNADGSYWVYSYDAMGQVTSGKKYWSDNTPVVGQQFAYTFDDIGNRKTTTRDTRSATYTPNTLNQYTSRTVPGYVNVLGTATNTATVSLWSKESTALFTPTSRKGDYFRGEMPFNNATGAMWLTITNVAVLSNYTGADIITNIAGSSLLAKTPETFTYDADGNLTSDSLWTNTWNGENRRTLISSGAGVPPAARVQETWTILADGRWIERIVSTWNTNTLNYQPSTTNRFVWDNQVLLAVLDHTNGVVVCFMRGLDLSGSIQGAGGVGGVLAVKAGTSAQCAAMTNTTHFTCYDGNGNLTALMNAATGEESARYERGPFAEELRETGPMAKLNPIRFSTQYADDVTGDTKYLFRDLRDGRWLSRDALNENGGENLYGAMLNQLIGKIDPFGLCPNDSCAGLLDYAQTPGSATKGKGITSPEQARSACQARIDQREKENKLPPPPTDNFKCVNGCEDIVNSIKSDNKVQDIFNQFKPNKCPLPEIVCVTCSGAAGARYRHPPLNRIEVCHDERGGDKKLREEFTKGQVIHELMHALQTCYAGPTKGCEDSLKREMEGYYCSFGQGNSPEQLMEGALDSSCGLHCTAQQAADAYRAVIQWFNKEKDNLCKFPRKPDYPQADR